MNPTDGSYPLPNPAGNNGPAVDVETVTNAGNASVIRQRVNAFPEGLNAVVNAAGNVPLSTVKCFVSGAYVFAAGGAGTIIFYDNPNAGNGTIIGEIPANAPKGYYPINGFCNLGLFAVAGASSAGCTVFIQPQGTI